LEGFLPYRNLFSKWKFFAFESWLRQRGLDPSMYRQSLVTTTNYDADSPSLKENDGNLEDKISPDMKLEDLLKIYDQEKNKFLSSFIGQVWYSKHKYTTQIYLSSFTAKGETSILSFLILRCQYIVLQKIKAYVFYADRKSKKLIFSLRPKENEELTEKRRNLMVNALVTSRTFVLD
jgi:hypothetical protein